MERWRSQFRERATVWSTHALETSRRALVIFYSLSLVCCALDITEYNPVSERWPKRRSSAIAIPGGWPLKVRGYKKCIVIFCEEIVTLYENNSAYKIIIVLLCEMWHRRLWTRWWVSSISNFPFVQIMAVERAVSACRHVGRANCDGGATSARQQVSSLSLHRGLPLPGCRLRCTSARNKLTESDSSRPKFRCGHSRHDRLK